MMRSLTPLLLLPGSALAHPGHLGELAGHDHWIALGALGIAIGLAVWAGLKPRKDDPPADEAEGDAPEDARA